MDWINVKDRLPEDDGDVLCWSVKFGDESIKECFESPYNSVVS